MYLPYRGCLTSRWISTRRVLSVLSRVTMPISVRRAFRGCCSVFVSAIAVLFWLFACRLLLIALLLFHEFLLPLHRLDAGDLSAGLADLARRFQAVGGRLEPQVEEVLLHPFERVRQFFGRHSSVFGGQFLAHGDPITSHACGGRTDT